MFLFELIPNGKSHFMGIPILMIVSDFSIVFGFKIVFGSWIVAYFAITYDYRIATVYYCDIVCDQLIKFYMESLGFSHSLIQGACNLQ